jgi:hypothetical protein
MVDRSTHQYPGCGNGGASAPPVHRRSHQAEAHSSAAMIPEPSEFLRFADSREQLPPDYSLQLRPPITDQCASASCYAFSQAPKSPCLLRTVNDHTGVSPNAPMGAGAGGRPCNQKPEQIQKVSNASKKRDCLRRLTYSAQCRSDCIPSGLVRPSPPSLLD